MMDLQPILPGKGLKEFLENLRRGSKKPQQELVPNRAVLRSKGINVAKLGGQHGRLTHVRPSPASFETLVAIHVKNANGKTVRKMVVPRSSVDPAMLAKRRSEQ